MASRVVARVGFPLAAGLFSFAGIPPRAAETPSAIADAQPVSTADGLPAILAAYPGGALTRLMFRSHLAETLEENPSAFDLPEGYINNEMMRRERERLELPPLDPGEAEQRFRQLEREAGGPDDFRLMLLGAQLTPRDAWRLCLRDAESFQLSQHLLKPPPLHPPLDSTQLDMLFQILRRSYQPSWFGVKAPLRVASFQRTYNISLDELLDRLIVDAPDIPMQGVFESVLEEALIKAECKRLNLPYTPDALANYYAEQISDAELLDFYEAHREEMALTSMAWILLAYPQSKSSIPNAAARPDHDSLLVEALRLRADIISGRISFSAAALLRSDDSASKQRNGVWGYVPAGDWAAEAIDAAAWRLDHFTDNGVRRSPVVAAPNPAVAKALAELKKNQISDAVEVPEGFALVSRLDDLPPPPEPRVRSDLRRWFISERGKAAINNLRGQTQIFWSPLQSRRSGDMQIDEGK